MKKTSQRKEPLNESEKYAWFEKRFEELVHLFKFMNSTSEKMQLERLLTSVYDYARFRFDEERGHETLGFTEVYTILAGGLLSPDAAQHFEEKKLFFIDLRDHLRHRLEIIIDAVDSGKKEPLFAVQGLYEFKIKAQGKAHRMDFFVPDEQVRGAAPDLELEKRKADGKLLLLIRVLGLRPDRFGRCMRCGQFFYQDTARRKRYCSPKCAGAVRQRRYMSRKDAKEGGDVANLK
jgi:hypothetical protein